jgi:sulfite reductase (NADPH) flavoprotein alpha-component
MPIGEILKRRGLLRPRYYSVASSQKVHPSSVDLIVRLIHREVPDGIREGLASGFMCRRLRLGERAKIFFKKTRFQLPHRPHTDVVMIGPGTGIAPFKAFLEERRARGDRGRNWLIFGDRHLANDFLLEETLLQYVQEGFLTRLDLAFSRDQEQKVYVQHKLMENGAEVIRWMERGAHLYLCGEAKRMAIDVEATLLKVFASSLRGGEAQAASFFQQLKLERRYQKDVY